MRIISISRRTDIPAWYLPWLLGRLHAGYCHVVPPFGGRIARVSLRPDDCRALVFWTRNPAPLLPHVAALHAEGYRFYTQVTITGYPSVLETCVPAADEAIAACHRLGDACGAEAVIWRYDPMLFADEYTGATHRRHFAALARALTGTTHRCIVSYIDIYAKTGKNLRALAAEGGGDWRAPGDDERLRLARDLAEIAGEYGMTLYACCEPDLVAAGIPRAHCVDAALIARLRPDLADQVPASPSRRGCGCAASVDIGAYDTCLHGCRYCYATRTRTIAAARHADHDPTDSLLWRPPWLRGVDLDHRIGEPAEEHCT